MDFTFTKESDAKSIRNFWDMLPYDRDKYVDRARYLVEHHYASGDVMELAIQIYMKEVPLHE